MVLQIMPNICCLLKLYVIVSYSEGAVKPMFSRIVLMMTKKCSSLEDNNLDMITKISYFKEKPLNMKVTKKIINNWQNTQGRQIFSDYI